MWRVLSLQIFCCVLRTLGALAADSTLDSPGEELALTGAVELSEPDRSAPSAAKAEGQRADEPRLLGLEPTSEPLEDELDNQENIISQVEKLLISNSKRSLKMCTVMKGTFHHHPSH